MYHGGWCSCLDKCGVLEGEDSREATVEKDDDNAEFSTSSSSSKIVPTTPKSFQPFIPEAISSSHSHSYRKAKGFCVNSSSYIDLVSM